MDEKDANDENLRVASKCSLDSDNCLNLALILEAFNGPINEEQAWALCFQTVKCIQASHQIYQCYSISHPKYMFIHKDGTIHEKTITFTDGKRRAVSSVLAMLSSLGVTLFQALDYGISEDEERSLDPKLEILIEKLASCDTPPNAVECEGFNSLDSKDEGIERDSPEDENDNQLSSGSMTLEKTIEMCVSHLSCPQQAESHYKAVCRALIAETLELSTFLEKIAKGTKELRKTSVVVVNEKLHEGSSSLDNLGVADWARLWMQVIRELRRGVDLKKVDRNIGHRMEYEMTPYEMLLDDIRLRRYKLNKVMVNGDIPQKVKKDAHALILEFIRSRPPLVPASKRQLPPAPPKQPTLYEKLMQSIREEHQLKPTPPSSTKTSPLHLGRVISVDKSERKPNETENVSTPKRRLIKPDLTLRLSNNYDEDDTIRKDLLDDDEDLTLDVVVSPNGETNEINLEESTSRVSHGSCKKQFSLEHFRKALRSHSFDKYSKPSVDEDDRQQEEDVFSPNRSDVFETDSSSKRESDSDQPHEYLSLTLDEVEHIRSVISKAELESLGVTVELREDLEKGKICFACLKTRFSFFGPRSVKCRLCHRNICEQCCTKMHVPTELYAEIPIHMLSPTFSPTKSKEVDFKEPRKDHKVDLKELKETKSIDGKNVGPLTTLCSDCKLFLLHITDIGFAKFNSDFRKTWLRKGKSFSQFSRTDVKSREDEELAQKSLS